MKVPSPLALLAAATLSLAATPATAAENQAVCAERARIVRDLDKDYREAPVALGIIDANTVLEVLTSEDGTTWTVILTRPNGQSCVMATGRAWHAAPVLAKAESNS